MTQQTMKTVWETMASNSTNNPVCPICGEDKPKVEVPHPFKDEMTEVTAACPCEIKEQEEFENRQKMQEKKRKIDRILKMSSELDNIKNLTFDNYEKRNGNEHVIQEVKNAVTNFSESKGMGLFIFGVSGNGKSHATAAGGNALLKRGYSVIFLTEKDLLNRLKATNNFNNHETFGEVMNAAVNADLLVWDDFLSSTRLSGDEKDWIFQIINGRERANKPIWFTSNLTPDEFQSKEIKTVLDPKERTWWRILNNTTPILNRATNYREQQVMKRVKGM
ncbi:MAG TPA: ATP-binding protein [Pseudogracilibacillus sp.]|nr:ATP-binding protein [Pseudogracilibacillus sp.]